MGASGEGDKNRGYIPGFGAINRCGWIEPLGLSPQRGEGHTFQPVHYCLQLPILLGTGGIQFTQLEPWLASSPALQRPLHQIESEQQATGRDVQRLLLQAHLQQRGHGDVGSALLAQRNDGEVRYTHRRLSKRSVTTIFAGGGALPLCCQNAVLSLGRRRIRFRVRRAVSPRCQRSNRCVAPMGPDAILCENQ